MLNEFYLRVKYISYLGNFTTSQNLAECNKKSPNKPVEFGEKFEPGVNGVFEYQSFSHNTVTTDNNAEFVSVGLFCKQAGIC